MASLSPAPGVQYMSATELKAHLDRGEAFELIDVRTEQERAIAAIEPSSLLDDGVHERLLGLDRDSPLVFLCHHGMRSQAAAEYFLRAGFRNVHNVIGGIDAWSTEVDASVPRY
jgi:monothiol glutaredoxin